MKLFTQRQYFAYAFLIRPETFNNSQKLCSQKTSKRWIHIWTILQGFTHFSSFPLFFQSLQFWYAFSIFYWCTGWVKKLDTLKMLLIWTFLRGFAQFFLWTPKTMSISDRMSGQLALLVRRGPRHKMFTIETEFGKGLTICWNGLPRNQYFGLKADTF